MSVDTRAFTDSMAEHLRDVVKVELDRIVEEEAKRAAASVQERVRKLIATVAFQMYDRVSIISVGRELVIRVEFDDAKKEAPHV